MKIREIRLTSFKRFTNTIFTDIPKTARLILLVGPNGCGKSSLIDAVHIWHKFHCLNINDWDATYHSKQMPGVNVNWRDSVTLSFHDPQPSDEQQRQKSVYTRSAYRNDPEFQLDSLSKVQPVVQEHRFRRLIDNDQAVNLNYRRLVSQGFQDIYETAHPDLTIGEFREQSIGEIRDVIQRLFPGLVLNNLGNPLSAGTFRFDKGESKAFLYKNLSGGEKAAFDLLLDITIKRRDYNDTVFFIDEPEAHMSPAAQSSLLGELFNAIPETSQLWLATHSIGMMRKARDLARDNPDSVVFIDFDDVNFDLPQTLRPIQPDRPFWSRAMQIALDDLAGYVTPESVVLCEGGQLEGGSGFDAQCYNEIFQNDYPHVIFLGAGNANDIQHDPRGVQRLIAALAPGVNITRIIDRDDRTDEEIKTLRAKNIRVLSRRTIESYLLDDQVLQQMAQSLGAPETANQLLEAKATALRNSMAAGGLPDDFKRIAGDIYTSAKRLFPTHKLGSDKRAFMKGICAPLIRELQPLYGELKKDVFNQ